MEDASPYKNKRFNAVGFCLTGIRVWQWTSSFFVYACFSLLYAHIRKNRLGENNRMKGVQVLVSTLFSQTFQHKHTLGYLSALWLTGRRKSRRVSYPSCTPPSSYALYTSSRPSVNGHGASLPLFPSQGT